MRWVGCTCCAGSEIERPTYGQAPWTSVPSPKAQASDDLEGSQRRPRCRAHCPRAILPHPSQDTVPAQKRSREIAAPRAHSQRAQRARSPAGSVACQEGVREAPAAGERCAVRHERHRVGLAQRTCRQRLDFAQVPRKGPQGGRREALMRPLGTEMQKPPECDEIHVF